MVESIKWFNTTTTNLADDSECWALTFNYLCVVKIDKTRWSSCILWIYEWRKELRTEDVVNIIIVVHANKHIYE